ncbi:MAG: exosortase/archaeosortase family protein [Candidatus Omnitrophota bacterium]|jgi:exosortase|nr:MAG: exosortase/archaeosortase family protein [Candidatus Omnitrophota bacterium]
MGKGSNFGFTQSLNKESVIRLAVIAGLIIISYIPTLIWMVERWTAKDTYYSHGFLVPFISLYLVWQKRPVLSKIKPQPLAKGWIVFAAGTLIHIISALWRVYFTSGFSILLVISGLILIFLGKEFLKKLIFPVLFLIFMIPLPLVAIANLSFKLKILAAQLSTVIINKLGVPAIRDGSVIKTMNSYIIVEDPCSGIRSLIALIALGALMAYNSSLPVIKKYILFVSAVPVAIAGNVIRIVALSLASEMYGSKLAAGLFHTVMGVVVFVFAFFALLLIGKVLE